MFEKKYYYINPTIEVISDNKAQKTIPSFGFSNKEYLKGILEIAKYSLSVVTAAPGIGKTRLLKELVFQSDFSKNQVLYIELKNLKVASIKEEINRILHDESPLILTTNEEINNVKGYFFKEKFILQDNEDIFICFDALDEVATDEIDLLISKLKRFILDFPKIKCVISCRDYFFKRLKIQFSDIQNPQEFVVKPFNRFQIKRFLEENSFTENNIDNVLDKYAIGFVDVGLINNPRILQTFISIAKFEGLESALAKSLSELMEAFIMNVLKSEDKAQKNDKEFKRVLLGKLALIMSLYQRTEITKGEFVSFLSDINSNLAISVLTQNGVNDFYDHTLLIANENTVQFHNREFQEYLAAKELIDLGKTEQHLYDLSFNNELSEFYPQWYNVIKYAVDINITIQDDLLEFIYKRNNSLDMEALIIFFSEDTYAIEQLDKSRKSKTFTEVFKFFQRNKWFLGTAISTKLSKYYNTNDEELIEEYLEYNNDLERLNSIEILTDLIKDKKIKNAKLWQVILIDKMLFDNSKEVKEAAINALISFDDFDLIKTIYEQFESDLNDLKKYFIKGLSKINPNNPYIIDIALRSSSWNEDRYELTMIKSPEGIKYLLTKLLNSEDALVKFYAISYYFDIIESNIRDVWDEEINDLIRKLVFKIKEYEYSQGLGEIFLKLWKEKNKNALDEIFEKLKNGINEKDEFRFIILLRDFLNSSNSEEFISKVNRENLSLPWLYSVFYYFKNADKVMFEIGQKYFQGEFENVKRQQAEMEKRFKRERSFDPYEEFQKYLASGNIYSQIFELYRNNRSNINDKWTTKDKDTFRQMLLETIKKYDFLNAHINVISISPQQVSYNASYIISIYPWVLELYDEFEILLVQYRKQLIQFLPFSQVNNKIEEYFDKLGILSEEEIKTFLNFYLDEREDDLFTLNIMTFFDFAIRYKVLQVIPILKEIVTNGQRFEEYKRIAALETIHKLQPDYNFYNKFFYDNIDKADLREITLKANGYLIENVNTYRDEAIKWRIEQVKIRVLEIMTDNPEFAYHDIEFQVQKFSSPLRVLNEETYLDYFISLLQQGILIYERGKMFEAYAIYIWETVFSYISNLKIYKSYRPIKKIEDILAKNSFKGESHLEWRVKKAKKEYMNYLLLPPSFSFCINQYNELKKKQFVNVSHPKDILYILNDILSNDIRKWIEYEGAYHFIGKLKRIQEDLIQKTIKGQFEKALLMKGIRNTDINREPELLDGIKPDFILNFGFIGKVVIELKLTKNIEIKSDIKRKQYARKLNQYLLGTYSDYCYYLIFQVTKKDDLAVYLSKIHDDYIQYQNIYVDGYNCLKGN